MIPASGSTATYSARLRGATALSLTLDALFIDCQMEWEDIFGGRVEETEITKRRHKMTTLRLDTDKKNLPSALPLLRLAEAEAATCFKSTFTNQAT